MQAGFLLYKEGGADEGNHPVIGQNANQLLSMYQ